MKKGKAIGCLFAFVTLVASGISFSGVKKVTADDIPREQHYVVPAGTVTNPFSYSDNYANEPNYKNTVQYRSTATGSDGVYYEFNQNSTVYSRMNVGSTWNSYRGEGVKVAVIDTGCYTSHEDFSGTNFSSLSKNIYNGGTSASSYTDTNGHGTSSVSTIAAAINSKGGVGIASNVELVVLKIDHPDYGMQLSYMESALQWCINNDVDVINMSLQGYESTVHYSYTEDFGNTSASGDSQGTMSEDDLSDKLTACYNAGITVVAAAGNYNTSQKSYPAANDHVIAVASTGLTEANKYKKAGYSNYGDWVDICAPGYISTPTTSSTSSYSITYGTSFSSPLVAGAIALYKCKYPNATPDQIEAALKYTARSLTWSGSGAGLIDVEEFLAHAPVESVTVDETEIELNTTETYTINATVLPSYAEQGLRYESTDTSVCTVDSNGKITANGVGNALVGVYSIQDDKVYEIIDVTVTEADGTPHTSSVALGDGVMTGSGDSGYITWSIDDVLTIKQEKGTGNNVGNYISSPRWYQNHIITFTPANNVTITSIVFTLNGSYNAGLTGATWSSGTYSLSSNTGTWTGETSDEFNVVMKSQTRPTAISVTYVNGSSGGSGGGSQTINYTVTFEANGGTGTMESATTNGSTYVTPACDFSRSGYTFSKWALNEISGDKYNAGALITNITSNITLIAIWTENSSGITYIDDDYGNYYSTITTQEGTSLRTALNSLNDSKRQRTMGYDGLKTYGQYTEIDWTGAANVSGKMFGFYNNALIANTWDNQATWNREHVWPKSLGGDSVEADMHMVRPASVSINSARGNKYYGTGSSNYDPGEFDVNYRGVAARIIFYSAIADTSLKLADVDSTSTSNQMGKLSDLLRWNLQYSPNRASDAPLALRIEQNRNKVMYSNTSLQGNRNPFIDHPEYACKIWGNTNSATKSICGLSGDTLSLSSQSATLETGESLTITATPSGSGTVNWSVDNPNVISLGATTGNEVTITAEQVGTTLITVTYGTATAYCNVTVTSSGGTTPVSDSETITFSELGYSDQTAVTSVNGTNFNVSFDKGTNNNAPKYYTSGSAVRVYGSNTFTVSSTTKNIVKIELTFGSSDGSNEITTDKATYSNGTWTGSASSVTFTVGGTSGHRRIAAIKVTYESSGGTPDPVVNSISIVEALNLDVYNNKTYTFEPVIDAEEGADTTISWESSDTTVATITDDGTITALKKGSTTITATCGDKSDTCQVTVTDSTPVAVITYEFEADVNEVPFMSGTNHIASVGVKVYQYSNGSNKTCVDTGSVNVDTSSLGYKTVSYVYNSVTYTTNVKVTNNETTYSESSQTEHSLYSGSSTSYQELSSQGGTKTYDCEVNNATQVDFSFTIQHTGNANTKFTHVVTMYTKSGSNTASETCVINISSKPATRTYTGSVTFSSAINITNFVLEFTTKQSGSNLRIQNVSATITAGGSNDFTLLEQAKAWGEYFIDQTRTQEVCLADTDAAKLSGLQSKWADLAYEYNHMVSGAKDVFFTSDDSKIVEARSHYLFIISKFGASSLGDAGAFVKDSSDNVLQAKANNVFNMLQDDSSAEMIIIISLVSVISVGVCLLIKKKKTIKSN